MSVVADLILKGHFAGLQQQLAEGKITGEEWEEKLRATLEIIDQIQKKNAGVLTEVQKETYLSIIRWLDKESKAQKTSDLNDDTSLDSLKIKLDTKPMKKASGKKSNGKATRRKIS